MTTWWQRPGIFYCCVLLLIRVVILPAGLPKGAIVLIPVTKCLFKFVLTAHIFIRGKKCALVLLKSSIFLSW